MTQAMTLSTYMQTDASGLAELVRQGKVTSETLVTLAYERIKATEPDLHNIVSLCQPAALEAARNLEDKGQPFLGVPILLKGLGHTYQASDASRGLSFMAEAKAKYDSKQAELFREAGFIILGQTTYPQLGWLNVTRSDMFGATTNPWDLTRNPGGSSGGSAAAVASGQVPMASSSDGGGSSRIPAAWSGLIGLHPSRKILRWDSEETRETVSHFAQAKTMRDIQTLFDFAVKESYRPTLVGAEEARDLPIAYTLETPAGTPLSEVAKEAVLEAVAFLREQGYVLEEVAYPVDGQALIKQYYVLAAYSAIELNEKAQTVLGRDLASEDVELITWGLYQAGQTLDMADVEAAWLYLETVTQEMTEFYQQYACLLTPTNAYPAPIAAYDYLEADKRSLMQDMGHLSKEDRIQLIYDQWLPAWTLTPYTQLANLTGMPALSLPTYLSDQGLPMGIMLSTGYLQDPCLLELGQLFEKHQRLLSLPFEAKDL